MPKDVPAAVMALIWLLTGVIIFGWLLMDFPTMYSFLFALVFFAVPVAVYKLLKKDRTTV